MKNLIIGIDPGVKTGIAVYDPELKRLLSVDTFKIYQAMQFILYYKENHFTVFVRIEDARLRKWYGNSGREVLQGAGSVKRDCGIWQDFLTDEYIDFDLVAPKNNRTKISAEMFKKITGYEGRTSEHGRDAAMMVYGINNQINKNGHKTVADS